MATGELDQAQAELDRLIDRTGPEGPAAAHFARIFDERVLRDLSSGPVTKLDPDDGVRDRLVTVAARMAAAAAELFADAWSFVGDVIVFGEAEGLRPLGVDARRLLPTGPLRRGVLLAGRAEPCPGTLRSRSCTRPCTRSCTRCS